ncbi:hypothetical protein N9F71_01435, partial [bacterium]|nr:hypothetical protein [bacterium]
MTHKLSARPFSFALKTRLTTYLRTTYLQTIHLQTIFRITEKPPSHFFIRRFSGFIAALSLSHAALAAPVF